MNKKKLLIGIAVIIAIAVILYLYKANKKAKENASLVEQGLATEKEKPTTLMGVVDDNLTSFLVVTGIVKSTPKPKRGTM